MNLPLTVTVLSLAICFGFALDDPLDGSTTITPQTTETPTSDATTTPTPTTTTPTITTAKPPKDEDPPIVTYDVPNGPYGDCIIFQAGIRLWFTYKNTTNKVVNRYIDVPADANETVSGTCGNETQTLKFVFNHGWTMSFTFSKTGKDLTDVAVHEFMLDYTMTKEYFPDIKDVTTYTAQVNQTLFQTHAKQGYLCTSNITTNVNDSTTLKKMQTIDVRVDSFRTENGTEFFDDYTQCAEDNKISNIVPIAVGAALGALVLIVLIAYLVGRKRNQRGYETV